ncbi:MAG: molybdopterin-dependent oxidoreductase [Planctomycetes bacterium]|nr:molybdopterin-dependent oxidoreductase [Planctomycetota bacterium]
MNECRFIGQETARPDAPAKARGAAEYIHDLERPRMLFGKIKFAEHAHARIVHVDTSRAERLPGVRAVLTGENTPEVRLGFLRDNVALKRGKVRQFRDEVAAVAAIDPDIAAEAVESIRVEYEPLPAVFDPMAALAEGAPLVHETDPAGRPRTGNLLPLTFRHVSGDLAEARRRSAHVVGGRFTVPRIQQSCMGTAGCIAELDDRGNLTIWTKTQIPFLAQRDFVKALAEMGLPGRNARVIVPALGGGFGTGLDTHAYEFIAILLARATGQAVKIVYSREEEFANLSPRQSATVTIEQGCDRDGRLTFREIDVLQDNGAYTSWGATYPGVMMLPATSLYRVPAVRFEAKIVYTNNTYCQAMRGYGNPEVTWAVESNLDELAETAGIDALELRRINSNQPGDVTPMGLKIGTCGLPECLSQTADKLGWSAKRGKGGAARRGVGIASLIHVGGSGRIYRSDASGVILRLDDFGNVYVHAGGVEMGQGHHAVLSLGVAEAVGVRPEQVFVNPTDTATCPWDVGTHASRGAFTALCAVQMAAKKLRARLFELAEPVFADELKRSAREHPEALRSVAIDKDHLELAEGVMFVREGPLAGEGWARVELGKVLRAIHFRAGGQMLTESAFYDPPSELPDWEKGRGDMSAAYVFGTQGVEVEVDVDTGDVKILRMVAVHDVGRVLHPQALRGQMYGALAQGVGYALYEEVLTRDGRVVNPNFTDYKLPTAGEMAFPIDLAFVEPHEPAGPFGAKGMGEPGLVPTAPAIANAICDAIGVRIRDLPITPEKIVTALRDKARAGGASQSDPRNR